MVVVGITDLTGSIMASRVQLRLVQLLLAGKPLGEAVENINHELGFRQLTLDEAVCLIREFAVGLTPVVGLIEKPSALDSFRPTPETPVQ